MATSWEEKFSACFLLIYGIPGSGKSLLVDHLLASSQSSRSPWNMVAVHFDDLLPSDLRTQVAEAKPMATQQFFLKEARQRVYSCIEHFTQLNNLGSGEGGQDGGSGSTVSPATPLISSPLPPPPSQWAEFVRSTNSSSCHDTAVLDTSGKIALRRPTVILLDDNMSLRSMRHEYHQLARQYQMGFAGLCIQCPTSLALQRNSLRQIPIPRSTIETMEQRLELPDPAQYHWEARNIVLRNDGEKETFLRSAWEKAVSLMEEALANPVPPLPEENTALKDSCRVANLDSYVHQADNTLRKCVSAAMRKGSGHQMRAQSTVEELVKRANSVRKQVLEELRAGRLGGEPLSNSISPTGAEFKGAVEAAFLLRLNMDTEDQ